MTNSYILKLLQCPNSLLFQTVAKHIVKRGTSSALEDALKIAKVYMLPTAEIYMVKIMELIDKDKVKKYSDCWFRTNQHHIIYLLPLNEE